MSEWTSEWPVERGCYWFYGWCWTSAIRRKEKPKLYLVEVRLGREKHPFYVTDGHFLFKTEGANGIWQKANLPRLPALSLPIGEEE